MKYFICLLLAFISWDAHCQITITDNKEANIDPAKKLDLSRRCLYLLSHHDYSKESQLGAETQPDLFIRLHFGLVNEHYSIRQDSVNDDGGPVREAIVISVRDTAIKEDLILRLLYYGITNYKLLHRHRKTAAVRHDQTWDEPSWDIEQIFKMGDNAEVTKALSVKF